MTEETKISFLLIARLLYDKGYREYVEAARITKRDYPNVQFLLLGSIDVEYPNHVPSDVVQRDDASGAIRYLGYAGDVGSVMRKSDCIVLPSYHEGMSRVLMEACAMGKPIITSDISGCRETVEDGRNGYLVPPMDKVALTDAIRRFLYLSDDARSRMGLYSRQLAESRFDVRDVIKVYRRITG